MSSTLHVCHTAMTDFTLAHFHHKIYMQHWEKYNMKLNYFYVKQGDNARLQFTISQLFMNVLCMNDAVVRNVEVFWPHFILGQIFWD